MPLGLEDVRRALEVRDPALAQRIVRLASEADPRPEQTPEAGVPTLPRFRASLRSVQFKKLDSDGRRAHRVQGLAALTASEAALAPPPRLGLHEVIVTLWETPGAYARAQLLEVIAECPLKWGPWKALKQIYKEAEAGGDLEVFGALAARFDGAVGQGRFDEVSGRTLRYLARRAWRHLRRLGEGLPAVYADACVAVLAAYPEETPWAGTWVANHIFYHEAGEYRRGRFAFRRRPSTLLKYRAFPGLWRRTPRPLFSLLERARSEQARRYAVDALKADFRGALREVEPAWAARLVPLRSRIVDDFVVWLLGNVPRFEQGAFVALGLHEPVLALLDSPSDAARSYAADYVRAHARDLPLARLIELVDNDHAAVRKVALDLIEARDPRKDVGLEAWGRILETDHGFDAAGRALSKHFGAKELTLDWFAARLTAEGGAVVRWATGRMPGLHKPAQVGVAWFVDLLDRDPPVRDAVDFALEQLEKLGLEAVPADAVQRLLLRPASRRQVRRWVTEERLPASALGADFLKALMDPVRWQADPVVAALRGKDAEAAETYREPDSGLAALARELLADVRKFKTDDLGFEWLLSLVARDDADLHGFALDYLTRAFLPADFADPTEAAAPAAAAQEADLGGASFLFTGKLATMTRGEATKKVSSAGGANASGVNAKLDYLVIGDEGSPLYGEGRKGSKQVKAEKLIADGAPMRIISETAFLKMLAGEPVGGDAASNEAGAARLWAMAFDPGPVDAPLARFARHYIRMHHPKICPAETDRYVDPGAEIPAEFLTFERVQPLLDDPRGAVRAVAVELARYEFGRWQPPLMALVALAESRHPEVRELVAQGFSADAHDPEWRDARIDPARLTPAAVYRFCESTRPEARELGMALIAAHPRLAVPGELFRLTESPDAGVRGFVVRQLWGLYRAKGVTQGWQPPAPKDGVAPPPVGRPAEDPAGAEDVRDFLRLTLFGIPPGRPPAAREGAGPRLKPLPARKAKLALIEVVRDLAVEDAGFAAHVRPVLHTFLGSRGASERAACLVALTRIDRAHPALAKEAA